MSPKDDKRLKIMTIAITVGLPLIFAVLIAYMPLINNNSKAATEALTETKNIKEIINIKFENIEEKFEAHITTCEETRKDLDEDISVNRKNFRKLADKLLESGTVKDLDLTERKLTETID